MAYICTLCPRMCGVERGKGFCGMGENPVIARAAPHFDEEPVISGERGSGTVFFSGCALKCRFCQNAPISHGGFGREISTKRLTEIYHELADKGVHNINLVNPTHFAMAVKESLKDFDRLPVVWNTGGYERKETIKEMEGLINVYLPDLKYMDKYSGRRYSGAENYFEYAGPALKEMLRQTGPAVIDENGIMQRGTMVRHLILPGRIDESKRILTWIAENLPGAWVSLMAQYMPMGNVEGVDELDRQLTQEEYDEVCDHMYDLGLEDGFMQELESSDSKYIPAFDLTGVQADSH